MPSLRVHAKSAPSDVPRPSHCTSTARAPAGAGSSRAARTAVRSSSRSASRAGASACRSRSWADATRGSGRGMESPRWRRDARAPAPPAHATRRRARRIADGSECLRRTCLLRSHDWAARLVYSSTGQQRSRAGDAPARLRRQTSSQQRRQVALATLNRDQTTAPTRPQTRRPDPVALLLSSAAQPRRGASGVRAATVAAAGTKIELFVGSDRYSRGALPPPTASTSCTCAVCTQARSTFVCHGMWWSRHGCTGGHGHSASRGAKKARRSGLAAQCSATKSYHAPVASSVAACWSMVPMSTGLNTMSSLQIWPHYRE
jgi:hypothetical protein